MRQYAIVSIMIQYLIITAQKKEVKRFCGLFPVFYKKIQVKGIIFMRIDKFLKVSRILKRRTVAQEACGEEKVLINGKPAKPAHPVKIGDVVEILYAAGTLKFKIVNIKETVKKDEASTLYEVIS